MHRFRHYLISIFSLRAVLLVACLALAIFIVGTGYKAALIPDYIWLTIAIVGQCVQTSALVDALRDQVFLKGHGYNGQTTVLVAIHVRNARSRLVILILNSLLGVMAPFIPSEPSASVPLSAKLFGFFVIFVFIFAEAVLVRNTILERRDRYRMAAMNGTPLPKSDHH